jgi:hypothetical protein
VKFFLIIICCVVASCSSPDAPDPKPDHDEQFIQIYFHYNLLDELDTFHGTYQKDLVIDGTVQTRMWLTANEQEIILTAVERIRFFSLPDTIHQYYSVMPDMGPQVLRIKYKDQDKSIVWYDGVAPNDKSIYYVEQIQNLLCSIIVAKPEYKALPEANGGYVKIRPTPAIPRQDLR